MRKVFLDCGSFDGSSVRFFRDNFSDADEYEIHCFEANEVLFGHYPIPGTIFHPFAVWTEDGEITFYRRNKANSQSSTLIKGKIKAQGRLRFSETKARSIDFSKWIKENFSKDDYIILKMDIECAEYEVLKKMFEDKTIEYIDEFYGELHHLKCGKSPAEAKADDVSIVENLAKHGLELFYWDAAPSPCDAPKHLNFEENRQLFQKYKYIHPDNNPNWPEPAKIEE